MPKIPKKKIGDSQRVGLDDFMLRIQKIEGIIYRAKRELTLLWEDLYVKGLDNPGPADKQDEIPF